MKRIALLTALVGLIVASCGDDNTEPPAMLYGKYAAENVTITLNGNTFTSPADVTLYKYDSSQPDSALFTIAVSPEFRVPIKLIIPVHDRGNQISLKGNFKHYDGYNSIPFRGTSSGTCMSNKINIDLKYKYSEIDENESRYLVPNKTIEIELTDENMHTFGYGKSLYYNGKLTDRSTLNRMAISPVLETIREKIGGSIIGLSYDENGDIKLYSKKDAHSEPEMFKGKFKKIFNLFAADEEGARYVSKKLFGKDEIVKELYFEKLGDYYLASFENYRILDYISHESLYHFECDRMHFIFWYAFMVDNGKESEAEILKFILDEDYIQAESIWGRGHSID